MEAKHSPLRRLRFDHGEPHLRKVAEETGLHAGTISRLERGKRNLLFDHAVALAIFYGIQPGDLLKEMAEWYTASRRPIAPPAASRVAA
jgi:transcriptional regulator with XRE-family HTH domain